MRHKLTSHSQILILILLLSFFHNNCFANNYSDSLYCNRDNLNGFLGSKTQLDSDINHFVSPATDTIIRVIRDSIDRIAINTKPQKLFGNDAIKANGTIALFAMIFGFFAMVFGFLGFLYQKKSANSLKKIEAKRIPFLIMANKIYTNILSLHILMDIERSDTSDDVKAQRRLGYGWKNIIQSMKMPEDKVDLSCYERYNTQDIYADAYNIVFSWGRFNNLLDDIILTYPEKDTYKLYAEYRRLERQLTELYDQLVAIEDKIIKSTLEIKSSFNIYNGKTGRKYLNPTAQFILEIIKKHVLISTDFDNKLLSKDVVDCPLIKLDYHYDFSESFISIRKKWKAHWYELPIVWIEKITSRKEIGDIVFKKRTYKLARFETEFLKILDLWYSTKYDKKIITTDYYDFYLENSIRNTLAMLSPFHSSGVSDVSEDREIHPLEESYNNCVEKLFGLDFDSNDFGEENGSDKLNTEIVDTLLNIFFTLDIAKQRRALISNSEFLEREENLIHNQ